MSKIINNCLYADPSNGVFWRAIYQDHQNDLLAICVFKEQRLESARLELVSLNSFEELIRTELCTLQSNDPFAVFYAEEDLSEGQKKILELRLALIQALIFTGIKLFMKPERVKLMSEAAHEHRVSIRSIKRYVSLYFSKGCTPSALVPLYENCGAPEAEKVSRRKLGRPGDPLIGMALAKPDKKLLQKGFKKYYADNSSSSMFRAYSNTMRKYFIKGVIADLDKLTDEEMLKMPLPSLYQFMYWGKKGISPAALEEKRVGNIIYAKDRQVLTGNATKDLSPGSLYQIDSTQLDLNIVSTLDPNLCIGKPILYLVTDVATSIIAGYTISLENASYISAGLALHNASLDKVELCKKYGLSIKSSDWPSSGVAAALLADRAELKGKMGDELVKNVGITLQIARSYRPDSKGNVESQLSTLQAKIKQLLHKKGAKTKLDNTRIGPNSREEAVLTLSRLDYILIRLIVDHNKRHVITDFPVTEDMVRDKVSPIPSEIWQYGFEKGFVCTRPINSQELYLKILPRTKASFDKEGVNMFGIDYTTKDRDVCKTLNNLLSAKVEKLEVAYDPRSLKKVFLVLNKKFIELVPRKSQLADRDLWDFNAIKTQLAKANNQKKKIESISLGVSDEYAEGIIEESTWSQDGKANTENMKENRKRDVNYEREDIFPLGDNNVEKPTASSGLKRKSFNDIISKI